MTQKHTPLPWYKNHRDEIVHETLPVKIATMHREGNEHEQLEANAAFIVRACNSHYELLEALEKCRALFSEIRNDWTDPRSECCSGWEIIDAAIAKAVSAP